jgi:hypothetical protein
MHVPSWEWCWLSTAQGRRFRDMAAVERWSSSGDNTPHEGSVVCDRHTPCLTAAHAASCLRDVLAQRAAEPPRLRWTSKATISASAS